MCAQTLTGCPARSGSSPAATSRRIASCSPSWYRWARVRVSSAPAGADSASSTAADHRGALRGQVPAQHPGALERGLQPHAAVPERPVRVVIRGTGPGPGVDLRGQPGQVPQVRPAAAAAISKIASASARQSCGSLPVHPQIVRA